ncbi:hypothetical protein AB6O49_10085 [Streptomyces sp. SBR177]
MIVAATQFAPVAGDVAANVETMAALVRAAGAEGPGSWSSPSSPSPATSRA